jgi:hypothetical protein
MLLPAALLAASAVALSLGVAVCGDPPATGARPAQAGEAAHALASGLPQTAQEALRACVRRSDQAVEAARLILVRQE